MSYQYFMSKIRHWDNLTAKWLMRHFYLMFFQLVLVAVFVFWFVNTINLIDANTEAAHHENLLTKILTIESTNVTILVLLLLLNSFWLLFIFNGIQRTIVILKDMNFHLSRLRFRNGK